MGIENSDIFASPCQIDISLFKQFHAIKYFTVSEAVPVPRPPGEGRVVGVSQPIRGQETLWRPMRGRDTDPAPPDIGIQPRPLVLPEILTGPSHLNTIRYIWGLGAWKVVQDA